MGSVRAEEGHLVKDEGERRVLTATIPEHSSLLLALHPDDRP